MRIRALLGSVFASAAILIVGWQAGAAALAPTSTTISQPLVSGTTGTKPTTTAPTTTTATGSTPAPAAPAAPAGPADGTYTGGSVGTRFGNVQVAVTISGGSITDVTALQLTDADGRSVQISNRAAPVLRSEVFASQSAHVSSVSGATYTTQGYLSSLQSALDQAGF